MKALASAALTAAALGASLAFAFNVAAEVPNDPHSVISSLKAEGYRVIITRVGSDHASECEVAEVTRRTVTTHQEPTRGARKRAPAVALPKQKIAYVKLAC